MAFVRVQSEAAASRPLFLWLQRCSSEEIGKVSLVPAPFDKAEHFVYFGIMAVLLCVGLGLRWFWAVLLVIPLVGALDEWHQYYVPGRDNSVVDWIADAAGALVAVFACWRIMSRRREQ
jgi:VanZ family protein